MLGTELISDLEKRYQNADVCKVSRKEEYRSRNTFKHDTWHLQHENGITTNKVHE